MNGPFHPLKDCDRHPNPLLDPSWRRVDAFSEDGPQLRPRPLKGSAPAQVEFARHPADAYLPDSDSDEDGAMVDSQLDTPLGSQLGSQFGATQDASQLQEWDYEEDEIYVTLDVGKSGTQQQHAANECAMAGFETDTPWLKFGRALYKGEWNELFGSEILLQETADRQRRLRPLASAPTMTEQLQEPSVTSHRILFTPVKPVPDKGAKVDHLKEFKHLKELASKPPKKTRADMSERELWQHKLELAFARREKADARGELDPVKSTRRGSKKNASDNGDSEDDDDE